MGRGASAAIRMMNAIRDGDTNYIRKVKSRRIVPAKLTRGNNSRKNGRKSSRPWSEQENDILMSLLDFRSGAAYLAARKMGLKRSYNAVEARLRMLRRVAASDHDHLETNCLSAAAKDSD